MKDKELIINRKILALVIMSILFGMFLEYSALQKLGFIWQMGLMVFLIVIIAIAIHLARDLKEKKTNTQE